MAQLRLDYEKFVALDAEVIVVGPDGPNAFKRYWEKEDFPYIGLADVGNRIADLYQQEVNLLKLGRMPAIFVIDREGVIRYRHYGSQMSDIPENEEILNILEAIK